MDVKTKEISDFATVSIGEFVNKTLQNPNGKYPVYNGGISNTGFYDSFNQTANKVIMSARGANAGYVNIIKQNYWAGNSCYTIDILEEDINLVYLYYYLKNNEAKILGSQQTGSIPAISKRQVEEFKIIVPPFDLQKKIVNILDKFNNYANSMTEGLAGEIEKNQQRYEYYRNSLLNFERK